jgi:hypothetical protein
MQTLPEILPTEGRHVLHLLFRVEYSNWDLLNKSARIAAKTALAELVREIRATPSTQLLLFSMVTPKADLGFMLLTPDLQTADAFAKRLATALGPDILTLFSAGCPSPSAANTRRAMPNTQPLWKPKKNSHPALLPSKKKWRRSELAWRSISRTALSPTCQTGP